MFENRVLGRMFGPKRDEVTGEWRKVHEELNDPYCSTNIIQVILNGGRTRWAWHRACIGERRNVYRVLV